MFFVFLGGEFLRPNFVSPWRNGSNTLFGALTWEREFIKVGACPAPAETIRLAGIQSTFKESTIHLAVFFFYPILKLNLELCVHCAKLFNYCRLSILYLSFNLFYNNIVYMTLLCSWKINFLLPFLSCYTKFFFLTNKLIWLIS